MYGAETTRDGKKIMVVFGYNEKMVAQVKTLSGARFRNVGGEKFWLVNRTAANVEKLMDWGFDVTTDLYQMVHPIIVK
jgi:hypothetical protein